MNKENILVLFGADSKVEWGRSFQLAKAFQANGHNVLYIDLPEPARNSLKNKKVNNRNKSDGKLFDIYRPALGLPYGRIRMLRSLNRKNIYYQIDRYITNNNIVPTVLWVYSPYDPEIALRIKNKYSIEKVIYDCADDRVALCTSARSKRTVESLEKELCSFCTCIVSITENLKSIKRGLHKNIFVVPNGIDTVMFRPDADLEMPAPYRNLPGRVILYAGAVEDWIDQETIGEAAQQYPDDSFVFVGPVRTDIRCLNGKSNVYFLGRQDYDAMPSYMLFADLCLIPFKDNDVTQACDPLKSLQYLAMGRPVLSTRYGGVKDYNGLVRVANSSEEFVKMVGAIIDNKFVPDHAILSSVLKAYSWKSLAHEAIQKVYSWT